MMDIVYKTRTEAKYWGFWNTDKNKAFVLEYLSNHTRVEDIQKSMRSMCHVPLDIWKDPITFKLAGHGLTLGTMIKTFSYGGADIKRRLCKELLEHPEALVYLEDNNLRRNVLNNMYRYIDTANKHTHYYSTFIKYTNPEIALNHFNNGIPKSSKIAPTS